MGHQRFGVPPSGALDPVALRLANALVGNPPGTAGLEIRFQGPELAVEGGIARIALAGAFDRSGLAPWRSHTAREGESLRIGRVKGIGVMAVAGGFAIAPVLGSLATYTRAGFGGLGGRALREGDVLPLARPAPEGPDRAMAPPPEAAGPVRVVLGPQDDAFTAGAIATFLAAEYVVGKDSDRMGLRLEGPALTHAGSADIVSDGVATGCIQVPGDGLPIVLLNDRGTVGGYPKIATVVSADLPRVGRMVAGEGIAFRAVTAAEAVALRRAQEGSIVRLIDGMRAIAADGAVASDVLLDSNLISGVVGPDDG
jgi:UPF0271 protein